MMTKEEAFKLIDLCSDAYYLAEFNHRYQKYGEHKYLHHLQQVYMELNDLYGMNKLSSRDKNKYHLEMVCWLHDIIEDTSVTKEELIEKGFPEEVVEAVDLVSKKDEQAYGDYLKGIVGNDLAFKVKVADTYSNLTESIKCNDTKRIRKYSQQLDKLYKFKERG